MPLFLADIHLYRARLFGDRDALAEARRLIEKHGYGRRREELEEGEGRHRPPEGTTLPKTRAREGGKLL